MSNAHYIKRQFCQTTIIAKDHYVKRPSCQMAIISNDYYVKRLLCQMTVFFHTTLRRCKRREGHFDQTVLAVLENKTSSTRLQTHFTRLFFAND